MPQRSKPRVLTTDSLITVSIWKDPEYPAMEGQLAMWWCSHVINTVMEESPGLVNDKDALHALRAAGASVVGKCGARPPPTLRLCGQEPGLLPPLSPHSVGCWAAGCPAPPLSVS